VPGPAACAAAGKASSSVARTNRRRRSTSRHYACQGGHVQGATGTVRGVDALDAPLTLPAQTPEPYLHVDNRTLVIFDGRSCVLFQHGAFPWVAETLRVLVDERRATRQQGPQILGGFLAADGAATLYAGTVHHVVTVTVGASELESLREKLAT
jgi:hypothetical protein